MPETIFRNQCMVTLTFDLMTIKSIGHILDSVYAQFHDDECKEKAFMYQKPFSIINTLTLPFNHLTPKSWTR